MHVDDEGAQDQGRRQDLRRKATALDRRLDRRSDRRPASPRKDAEARAATSATVMELADKYAALEVRTNADTPDDAKRARDFGAEGIGLCRTEHMFFEGERIDAMREMILADDEARSPQGARQAAAAAAQGLRRHLQGDGRPAGDDPPARSAAARILAARRRRARPAWPRRSACRAEQDQARASSSCTSSTRCSATAAAAWASPIRRSSRCRCARSSKPACNVQGKGRQGHARDHDSAGRHGARTRMLQADVDPRRSADAGLRREAATTLHYLVGTMIEIPRAALTADEIGKQAEFFSFGTNDLTQMTFGFCRDDVGTFLPDYLKRESSSTIRSRSLDQEGVGQLVEMGVEKGRSARPGPQGRHLRRARRRSGLDQVLPQGRAGLRELLAVPRADRPAGGGAGGARHVRQAPRHSRSNGYVGRWRVASGA